MNVGREVAGILKGIKMYTQLVMKLPNFYGIRKFITMFKNACDCSLGHSKFEIVGNDS
jgi:hypothetical protein